jgi:hypothetical protein
MQISLFHKNFINYLAKNTSFIKFVTLLKGIID